MHLLMEWEIHLTDVEGLTEALNVEGKVSSLSTSCCSQLCGRLRIETFVCLFFTSENSTNFHHFTRWQMKDKRSDGEPSFPANRWRTYFSHDLEKIQKAHTGVTSRRCCTWLAWLAPRPTQAAQVHTGHSGDVFFWSHVFVLISS